MYIPHGIPSEDKLTLLNGRIARCSCRLERPSVDAINGSLAFFDYWGPESTENDKYCAECGLFKRVHNDFLWSKRPEITPHEPTDRQPREFDTFYCGCRGWD